VAQDLEPEYIATNNTTAYVACQENNAFAIVDINTATVTDIVALGTKDHSLPGNEIDPSDRDSGINIANWPVKGFYMPDAIASFEINGQTYIVSANEGDGRDYDAFSDEDRVKDLTLDPMAFPDAATLQEDENLGRLTVSTADGISEAKAFSADFSGNQEVPAVTTEASGSGSLRLSEDGTVLSYEFTISGLDFGVLAGGEAQTIDEGDDVIMMHIHNADRGSNGGVVFGILMPSQDGDDFQVVINEDGSATVSGAWEEADESNQALSDFVEALRNASEGDDLALYFNIHTNRVRSGEVRAQIVAGAPLYNEIFSFGSRSFTIWDATGNLVYDSGAELEQITAAAFPADFNANNDENDSFESRSDNKGPEPEGVVTGVINGRTYSFLGLERIGGITVHDVTDPTAPKFIQYINNRDFSVADVEADLEAAGDLGPEGLVFISAEDSPNGQSLLVVTNEVSGSVSVYGIDVPAEPFTLQLLHASDLEGGVEAISNAPNFAAITDALEERVDNTVIISGGDNYIPGPFFNAAADRSIRDLLQDVYQDFFNEPGLSNL
ncbi:MAG: CHRD domain-containing protein, partial [Bacteroidota bacterium]